MLNLFKKPLPQTRKKRVAFDVVPYPDGLANSPVMLQEALSKYGVKVLEWPVDASVIHMSTVPKWWRDAWWNARAQKGCATDSGDVEGWDCDDEAGGLIDWAKCGLNAFRHPSHGGAAMMHLRLTTRVPVFKGIDGEIPGWKAHEVVAIGTYHDPIIMDPFTSDAYPIADLIQQYGAHDMAAHW